ncbi:MAG: extracellular solute-binding protein [Bacillota bacterium]
MKKFGLLFLVLLVMGMLVSVSAYAEEDELTGTLTIWSWGAGAEKEAREEMVEAFAEKHPELEIKHSVIPTEDSVWDQKQAAAFAAGNAADVMQMSPDYYGLMTEHYEDLNPYLEKDDINLDEVVTDGMMDGYYRPNDKLEALPLLANTFVFAYNKDMFDEFGVEYPTDDWTWEDYAEMAPEFASGEGFNRTYFMANHWVTPNFGIIAKGGKPYTDDLQTPLIDSEEVAESLNMFGELVDDGAMPSSSASQNMPQQQLFINERAAVYPIGGFEIVSLVEEIGDSFEWDAVLPPKTNEDGENTNITYATGYAMNKDAENKEAAWEFLKEASFANEEMQKITAKIGMPANKEVANNYYSDITNGPVPNSKFIEGMTTSTLNPWGGAFATAGDEWEQMWENVIDTDMTAEEAQEKYVPLIEEAFEELDL